MLMAISCLYLFCFSARFGVSLQRQMIFGWLKDELFVIRIPGKKINKGRPLSIQTHYFSERDQYLNTVNICNLLIC
jgi:hypothetical protein